MSHITRKPVFGVWTWLHINRPAQLQKLASLEILDLETRGIILSKQPMTKDADQTVQMSRLIRVFVVCIWHKQVFSYVA